MNKHIPKNPILFGIFISKLYKKWALSALLCVFLATGFGRLNLFVLRNLADSISATSFDIKTIWMWAILYPFFFFMGQNAWRASGFTGMRWFMNLRFAAFQSLYEYLTLHSKDYFNSRFAGSLANKINNAVNGVEALFEKVLWNFIPMIISLFWYIGLAATSEYRLGLIVGVWAVIFLSINMWFAKKLQPTSRSAADAQSALQGRVVDSLSNISLVHEYAYIAGEREYIKDFARKSRDTGMAAWQLSEWVLFANGILIFIFMFLMVTTSVYLFQMKLVSVGVVVMVIAIVGSLIEQMIFLGQEMRNAARMYGEAKEGLEAILHPHAIVDKPSAAELKVTTGSISIESIEFEYENTKVFKDFTLNIPAGQKVGFVGRSGAGKTTFVSLLLRHFDLQNGSIKIDGQDILDVTLESLRRAIAFVPQDTSLFHRTIQANISYSNPNATHEEMILAARQAQADQFIQRLPKGYETLVGERGVKLSGGQRQRIALARAFLKNSPILVLDEATSSLDSESEQAIQVSLEELMKNRTVIAIAHRLSTLKKMDRIIVIKDGKVVEDGHPDELLQKPVGVFKNMWEHQVKGFIVDE